MKLNLIAAALVTLFATSARAEYLNFDRAPATNNNTPYTGLFGELSATNAGTWDGLSHGDPGHWGVEGTNLPNFLGFNEASGYSETVDLSGAHDNYAVADFSRALGSKDETIVMTAFYSNGEVDQTSAILGPVNSWTTLSIGDNFEFITSVQWTGFGTGSHPYAVDNFISAPEPTTWAMMLVGFGGLGGIMRGARGASRRARRLESI